MSNNDTVVAVYNNHSEAEQADRRRAVQPGYP
jgi:hypothetical protein